MSNTRDILKVQGHHGHNQYACFRDPRNREFVFGVWKELTHSLMQEADNKLKFRQSRSASINAHRSSGQIFITVPIILGLLVSSILVLFFGWNDLMVFISLLFVILMIWIGRILHRAHHSAIDRYIEKYSKSRSGAFGPSVKVKQRGSLYDIRPGQDPDKDN